jgi:hypothetical protein
MRKTELNGLRAHENPSHTAIAISPTNESDIRYAVMLASRAGMIRHARPRAGHPRLSLPMLQRRGWPDKPGHDKADVARTKCAAWSRIQKVPESKSPRPVSRRGLTSCDVEHMPVICPTCQILFRRAILPATQGARALK